MKCQSLFSGKNYKNVLNYHLLNFLSSMVVSSVDSDQIVQMCQLI